jgi:hypothetical protein
MWAKLRSRWSWPTECETEDMSARLFWIPSVSQESIEQAYMDIAQHLELQEVSPADVKKR